MRIIKTNLGKVNEEVVKTCFNVIKAGGVVVIPTDTIYGFVCDATNSNAVEKTFRIKKRSFSKPMGIFIGDIKMAKEYVKMKKDQQELLKTTNTFVFKSKKQLPYQGNNLGVRLPRSYLILEIIKKLGSPLLQTSANLSGEETSNNIKDIIKTFSTQEIKPDLIIDAGDLGRKKASKVIDLTKKESRVIRN